MTDNSVELLDRWRTGDEAAAQEIFNRYVNRLIGLARSRLSGKMQRRVDPEDLVQSVYRSFFRHAQDGRYELERTGDLWRLLSAIAVKKVLRKVEFHTAKVRTVDMEASVVGSSSMYGLPPEQLAREPTPDEAAAIAEILESFMDSLDSIHRTILEMKLQDPDISNEAIADVVGRSPHMVRKYFNKIEKDLREIATQS